MSWPAWQAVRRLSDRTPLRTKLIAAVLTLVIMALAAISLASVWLLRSYLTTQYDGHLRNSLNNILNSNIVGTAGYAYPQGSELVAGIQPPGTQLTWRGSGNFLPGPGFPEEQSLPALPTGKGWAGSSPGGVFVTVPALTGPDSWRVIATTISYPVETSSGTQQQSCALVVAVDLGNISATMTRVALFDLIVSIAIIVVLAAVGAAVVQANLRPLNDIELTAGQIAAGHLDHRVPEGDPRTEVGSLGRSLNAMLSQIEAAFHAQEESERAAHESEERMRRFVADASHELRTPLTTIRGFAAHYRQRGGAIGWRAAMNGGRAGGPGYRDQPASARPDGLVPAVGNGAEPEAGRPEAGRPAAGRLVSETSAPAAAGSAPGPGAAGGGSDGLAPDDLDHLMGRVEAEATRMGILVEDLLTLARLDQQRPLHIAPVDLLTLAADAVQDARIISPGRPIDLLVAPGAAFLVDGDEPRLRQVLANLVSNALTHTPPGTPVRVRIAPGTLAPPAGRAAAATAAPGPGPDRQAEGAAGGSGASPVQAGEQDAAGAGGAAVPAVVLDIEDDGPGMTAEQARRAFERFYRADAARNRASGGTGLGLAIVAGLVAAHGGTVAVRTAPGQGADFQVRLPLSPDAQPLDDPADEA